MPFVVKLKSRLPVTAAAVITVNARTSIAGDRDTLALPPLRFDGASVSFGQDDREHDAARDRTSPGTTNAARQPSHFTRNPVTSAATAMPRLPASPLTPITAPGLWTFWTSIGMPTGW